MTKCCGEEISIEIIKNIKEGGVHNITFDQSQLSLSVWYLHGSEIKDFIVFINITEEVTKFLKYDEEATSQEPIVTGQNIGSFKNVKKIWSDLDLKNYVEISTWFWH